jgi:hypothetical protein
MSTDIVPSFKSVPSTAKVRSAITRCAVSEERQDAYIRTLERTGSHFEASRVATPHANPMKPRADGVENSPSGYQTFLKLRKESPAFAARCEEALSRAIGRAEAMLKDRMELPTERATLDKSGTIVHISKDFKNADALLRTFLARHRPEWVDSQKRSVEATITHVGSESVGCATYTIRADDLDLLATEDARTLMELLSKLEDARLGEKGGTPEAQAELPELVGATNE